MLPFAVQKTQCSLWDHVKSRYNPLSNFVTAPVSFCSVFSLRRLYMPIKIWIMFFQGYQGSAGSPLSLPYDKLLQESSVNLSISRLYFGLTKISKCNIFLGMLEKRNQLAKKKIMIVPSFLESYWETDLSKKNKTFLLFLFLWICWWAIFISPQV